MMAATPNSTRSTDRFYGATGGKAFRRSKMLRIIHPTAPPARVATTTWRTVVGVSSGFRFNVGRGSL